MDNIISYIINLINCHPTALATVFLGIITVCFVYITGKESQKYRRFKLILKKLDEFYAPLIGYLSVVKNDLGYIKSIKDKNNFTGAFLSYLKPSMPTTINEQWIKDTLWAFASSVLFNSKDKIINEATNFDKIKEIILTKKHLAEKKTNEKMIKYMEYENDLNFLIIKTFLDKFNDLYGNNVNFEEYPDKKNVYGLVSRAKIDNWEEFYKILGNNYDKLIGELHKLSS